MDILGVGPLELLVILALILIFVGPERLPQVARQIGKVYRQLHEMSRMVAAQWQEELNAAADLGGEKTDLRKVLSEPLQAAKEDAERMLTASLTTSYEQPGNAKPSTASVPTVPVSAIVTESDGRTTNEVSTTVVPTEVTSEQKAQEGGEVTLSPDVVAPAAEAAEVSPSTSEDVTDAVPPMTPPSDGNPEHDDQ
ncbi:MAG: twin-arginine translocase TatA/TatE family subunit [Anaerolineae bacterium]